MTLPSPSTKNRYIPSFLLHWDVSPVLPRCPAEIPAKGNSLFPTINNSTVNKVLEIQIFQSSNAFKRAMSKYRFYHPEWAMLERLHINIALSIVRTYACPCWYKWECCLGNPAYNTVQNSLRVQFFRNNSWATI